jgi:uncharacterized protein YqeY
MTITEKISLDMTAAMKSGERLRLETLRTIRAGLLEKQVERRPSGGMKEEDEMAVLSQAAKKRKEAATIFRQNNRPELADQEEKELAIIQEYLPKQLSEADVVEKIKQVIAQTGAASGADFGKVMPLVMKELKGKADGKLIQESVKRLLGA